MTEPAVATPEVVDREPGDPDLAVGATGLLGELNRAGVLTVADVHVADRLAVLGAEPDEAVRLAAALAVRAARSGSVCVDLAEVPQLAPGMPWPDHDTWVRRVTGSVLLDESGPLRWEYDRLYLTRYRQEEEQVRDDLVDRARQVPPPVDTERLAAGLDRLFAVPAGQDPASALGVADQRAAARAVVHGWTTVLGGGPGTGKTTTVARVLSLLLDQPSPGGSDHSPAGPPLRVALAAPTGKAAARLQEAVNAEAARFDPADRHGLDRIEAVTVHRLLGSRPGRSQRFRHDRHHRLPYDVVVVDETSMVSLTLMARLLEAVRRDCRLVLLGDPDQLSSVDAGAVLGDLVDGLPDLAAGDAPAAGSSPAPIEGTTTPPAVVLLRHPFRFGSAIAALAEAVRDGDADRALELLLDAAGPLRLVADVRDPLVRTPVVQAALGVVAAARQGDAGTALEHLLSHRLLCAHRSGPRGVSDWEARVERWVAESGVSVSPGRWYVGRPVLVTTNDYTLGLYNGDSGVTIADADGGLRVAFPAPQGWRTFAPRRLASVQTTHALTVHRSQGSQFGHVTFVLPEQDSPLATRELLYTALTRARAGVTLVGSVDELRAAVQRPVTRASGLRERLRDRRGG